MLANAKIVVIFTALATLFACTTTKITPQKAKSTGYLKENITQGELNNRTQYKRYDYRCKNMASHSTVHLITYFPLSRESRLKENFGFYFQLAQAKAVPFDHIANIPLNAGGTKFEVVYRSYRPMEGSYVDLVARAQSSTYYKNQQGVQVPWLVCHGG